MPDTGVLPQDEEQQQYLPGLDSWELQLKKLLNTMPDKGFERLCADIMTKNGVNSTKVTGQSGDKGIDGEGIWSHDPLSLVTTRVAWQCKRFENGKVSSQAVRDFRGALDTDTKHGVIFTTSSFTAEAEKESKHLGKTPIKLVNLEDLVEILHDLELGVKVEQIRVLDKAFLTTTSIQLEETPRTFLFLRTTRPASASFPCHS